MEDKKPAPKSDSKQEWQTPELSELGISETQAAGIPFGVADSRGNSKS